ncbi:hypothetical protein GE061_000543 [Apolygus lucorum]|uniref:Secreted protein n=1 Tax=Apolygus lucorum TaxID=248454 RepID=A0A8S9Y4W2_APOLU|nr:hypothetical protein GE061_000543 [Apolygus lucorum]
MMLLIGHWSGCLQFLVPMLQGFPQNSWVHQRIAICLFVEYDQRDPLTLDLRTNLRTPIHVNPCYLLGVILTSFA